MMNSITKTDFRLGYTVWKSYDDLNNWAAVQLCNIKQLVKDFYLQVFAIYDFHYLKQSNFIKTNKDIPKKIRQVFNNQTYLLKRYAGLVNERHPELYIKMFECAPYLELQFFGRTFTKFFTPKVGTKVTYDVPIPGTHFRAHFFQDFTYYVFMDTNTGRFKQINYYAQLVEDFLKIKILDINNEEVRYEYKIS